jgi:hypothetical protein
VTLHLVSGFYSSGASSRNGACRRPVNHRDRSRADTNLSAMRLGWRARCTGSLASLRARKTKEAAEHENYAGSRQDRFPSPLMDARSLLAPYRIDHGGDGQPLSVLLVRPLVYRHEVAHARQHAQRRRSRLR